MKTKRKSQFSIVIKRITKNKLAMLGFFIIIGLVILVIFADYIAPYSYEEQDYLALLQKPDLTSEHPLGTDNLGRDVLSRLIYGTRYSLKMGVFAVGLNAIFGLTLGAIAGYCGGWIDNALMRFLDIFQSIPGILMAMALAAVFGSGLNSAIIALGITGFGGFARLIRASVLQLSGEEYVEAARAINARHHRILLRHIIPNALAPIIIQVSMSIGATILAGASMSFLGLGAQAPLPEWGTMLSDARNYMRDSGYLLIFPGLMIFFTVMAFNLLGDGLRDALDPKLKD
ncbi:ABC transporter permease [Eisenbergiella massiliensis]|uniref:ABC transporter permease n=1 Tax=Eisenbergiella massiliensis TaxID=1720294 RepID=A0A3E3I4Q6_9FIRM|nr:ABC transporter permease [Eisenbergiella massiliensis]RGE60258.1 ABC transporter permease [Eisenbergiella massiliensis]